MRGRGVGLILGLTGMVLAGAAGAQTASSASAAASSGMSGPSKPRPAVTPAPANGKPLPALGSPSKAPSPGPRPGTPRPAAIPPQPTAVPAECLTFDTTPFGALQGLDITGPTHAPVHFDVEVASQPSQRGQGLMCRMKLPVRQGMLFEFPRAGQQIFWMHDTVLPLDILYIAPDGHIVSITRGARPLSDRKLPSHGVANGVLEINAGLADTYGLKAGDVVAHPFFVAAAAVPVPGPSPSPGNPAQ